MFTSKPNPENFAFVLLRIIELCTHEFCKFSLTCIVSQCLYTSISHISDWLSLVSRLHISDSKKIYNVNSSAYYFHVRMKILADFQICFSLLLKVAQSLLCFSEQYICHFGFFPPPPVECLLLGLNPDNFWKFASPVNQEFSTKNIFRKYVRARALLLTK